MSSEHGFYWEVWTAPRVTDTDYFLLGIWGIQGRCLTRSRRSRILGVVSEWLKSALVDHLRDRKMFSIVPVGSKPHSTFHSIVDHFTALKSLCGRMESCCNSYIKLITIRWKKKHTPCVCIPTETTEMSHPLGGNRVWYRLRIDWIKLLWEGLITKNYYYKSRKTLNKLQLL